MKKLVLMAVMTALMSINAIAQYKVHFQVNKSTTQQARARPLPP